MTISVTVNPSQDSGRPTELFTARKIGELALQLINAYSVNDTVADPVELERAREWMELNVGQLAGTQSCWWLTVHKSHGGSQPARTGDYE